MPVLLVPGVRGIGSQLDGFKELVFSTLILPQTNQPAAFNQSFQIGCFHDFLLLFQ